MPVALDTKPTPTKLARSVFEITVDHPYTDRDGVRQPANIILSRKHMTKNDAGTPSHWTTAAGWGDLTAPQKAALRNALRSIILADAAVLSLAAEDA